MSDVIDARTPWAVVRRTLAVVIALCLLSTACTSDFSFSGDPAVRDPDEAATSLEPPSDETSTSADEDAVEGEDPDGDVEDPADDSDVRPPRVEEQEASDRIAVQTLDGQLFTVMPDGDDRIDLTDPGTSRFNRQPTWAPDAARIAWVGQTNDGEPHLRTARFDLTSQTEHTVEAAPFYLNWDPSSSQIAFLAPNAAGIDLGLASLSDALSSEDDNPVGETSVLDRGEPYFFSWGPDSDELLVHASGFRLDRINVDGSTRVIDEFPALFQAPVWLSEADDLVYADEREGETFLVISGSLGEGRTELASFRGFLNFTVNPTGTYAAMVTRQPRQGLDDGGIVTAGFGQLEQSQIEPAQFNPDPDDRTDIVDVLPFNTLGFIALYGGDLQTLSNENVVAFWWDPTGDLLAWLEPSPRDPGVLQWWFSDRREIWSGVEFAPSQTFATSYLPFFDQYAQSHTLFSPDGTQLTFAGRLSDGTSGVFVVDTAPDSEATKIADGVFSVWSPTTAGGGASVL